MLNQALEKKLQEAVRAVLPDANTANILVRPCPDPKFGDYQTNALMSLAKERKMNPRQLATDVVAKLDVSEWCEKVEIAGAGFLNFRLKNSAIEQTLQSASRGEHLFFQKAAAPRTIVIDFSSPNVAKPMHVGHIRSTILGDSLARVLRLLGHNVITDNHIGDWGTQFGKLLIGWKYLLDQNALKADPIAEMERLYKVVNFVCELDEEGARVVLLAMNGALGENQSTIVDLSDEAFDQYVQSPSGTPAEAEFKLASRILKKGGFLDASLKTLVSERFTSGLRKALQLNTDLKAREGRNLLEAARLELVKLQGGDEENLRIWREMIALSQHQFDTIYGRLGVKFDKTLGESFYNPWLGGVVKDLRAQNIASESEGAVVVFSDGKMPPQNDPFLTQRDGQWQPNPALIQKSDGGFNYATTDLATLKYRMETWNPSEIVYVTDGRQQLHFNQIFATFRRWHPEVNVKLAHVWFGSILGEDGKPFKTRSGDTVKLADLLDEAEERVLTLVSEKNSEFGEGERKEIARIVGLGAVKYADLQQNRQSDYIFSWDKMLALQGNTSPYLQYAYTRVSSIFRRAADQFSRTIAEAAVQLSAAEEIRLAKHLLNFGMALQAMADDYRPNYLCQYLFELAGYFASFYENCPVLKVEEPQRSSRLVLCELTARVLKQGLEVLGIETTEQM